jgi:hypothetical protein
LANHLQRLDQSNTGSGLGGLAFHGAMLGAAAAFFGVVLGISPLTHWLFWLWAGAFGWHALRTLRPGPPGPPPSLTVGMLNRGLGRARVPQDLGLALVGLSEQAPTGVNVYGVAEAAVRLVVARDDLERSVDVRGRARLEVELVDAKERLDDAEDPLTRQAIEEEIAAIDTRLVGMASAEQAVERMRARERTLVHQLEELSLTCRHQVAVESSHDALEYTEVPALEDKLEQLRLEVEAEAELELALPAL